jgi:alcohol dehydrogenase class IV
VSGLSVREAAELSVEAVHRLKAEIGIPMKLRELGVEEQALRPLAEDTAKVTRLLAMNPRPLDVDALEGILREAW